MKLVPFKIREIFHLLLLKELNKKLASRSFALKGGVNLRFFLLSPRLSEDIDFDIDPKIHIATLKKNVDEILKKSYLLTLLHQYGIKRIEFSSPKQTQTVQRWKISLYVNADHFLSTKIEFSKRVSHIQYVVAIPSPDILLEYSMQQFSCKIYSAQEILKQKVNALSSENRFAVRDLFDLNHLLINPSIQKKNISFAQKTILLSAKDKIANFSNNDFKKQVIPFLPDELIEYYKDVNNFNSIKNNVSNFIKSLL